MLVVLAGLDGRRRHGALRDRQGHNYANVNFRGTMMSHAPSLTSECTLPVAVVLPAQSALLVHSRRLAQLRGPGGVPAQRRAVLLAVIATATQEEDPLTR